MILQETRVQRRTIGTTIRTLEVPLRRTSAIAEPRPDTATTHRDLHRWRTTGIASQKAWILTKMTGPGERGNARNRKLT